MKRIIRIAICVVCVLIFAMSSSGYGRINTDAAQNGIGIATVNIRIVVKNTPVFPGDRYPVGVTISPQRYSVSVLKHLRWYTNNPAVFRIVGNWPIAIRPGPATLFLFYNGRLVGTSQLSVVKKMRYKP